MKPAAAVATYLNLSWRLTDRIHLCPPDNWPHVQFDIYLTQCTLLITFVIIIVIVVVMLLWFVVSVSPVADVVLFAATTAG